MSITYLIIGFTALISIMAFNNYDLSVKLRHWPYRELRYREYYRWLTSGFLHGDWMHLIFNMMTLYFFGRVTEMFFEHYFGSLGTLLFVVFYLLAIVASSYGTFNRHKDNPHFASIGASGAVAAVLFAAILFMPLQPIMLMLIPIPIPGFIFGVLYLWFSHYEARRGADNIDHLAHFFGAVFGFFFPLLLKPELFMRFVEQLMSYFQ